MKLLKQKILFLLYFAQNWTPAKSFKKEAEYLSYNFLYRLLPEYGQASVRKAAGELINEGLLDKIIRNQQTFFRLTIIGEKKFRELGAGLFCQRIQRRGWFLAVLKAKKGVRQTRRRLEELGFVKFTRGVYLKPAPRDFEAELESLATKTLFLFSLKLEFADERNLAAELWKLNQAHKRGSDFINQAKLVLKKIEKKKSLDRKAIQAISSLSDKFFIIIKETVKLPKNLLPHDWPMPEAAEAMARLLKKAG